MLTSWSSSIGGCGPESVARSEAKHRARCLTASQSSVMNRLMKVPGSRPEEDVGTTSQMWDLIYSQHGNINVSTFQQPGGLTSRFAHWEPKEKSLRWFKSYLLLAAETAPLPERAIYEQFGSTDLGSPVTVTVDSPVNLVYLLAAEELAFLEPLLGSVESVTEVGVGFGRTAHAL